MDKVIFFQSTETAINILSFVNIRLKEQLTNHNYMA